MRVVAITLDERGGAVAEALAPVFPGLRELRSGRDGQLRDLFRQAFLEAEGLVCVMACGIVVRMVGPLAVSKLSDPAVVVVDDEARWALSLLSGHEGGANDLAYEVAAALGAEPVITTGTDTRRRVILGVGCRRGTTAAEIREAVLETLTLAGYAPRDVRRGASARIKVDEGGLREAFRDLGIPLVFIDEDRINTYDGPYDRSEAAERRLGLRAVAEPCALLAGRRTRLVIRKRVYPRVTVAVAVEE